MILWNKLINRTTEFEYVSFLNDPAWIFSRKKRLGHIKEWCQKNLQDGTYEIKSEMTTRAVFDRIIFYDEKDAIAFRLATGL